MLISPAPLAGVFELQPQVYPDNRGFFLESFHFQKLRENGLISDYIQDNQSFSYKGVVRGFHLQLDPNAQVKLVRVVWGKVLDVVVDLRAGSATFGKSFQCELSAEKCNMVYIPEGFAHGFAALEDSVLLYKCSGYYAPASEAGVRWDDPEIGVDWPLVNPTVSEKDKKLPLLNQFKELIDFA